MVQIPPRLPQQTLSKLGFVTAPEPLFHCFGSHQSHVVDTDTAVAMLRTSGCHYLTINTHSIATLSRSEDLPVGYGDATFGSVRHAFASHELTPVLNINMPTTIAEAVARARSAYALTGERIIKLEVLNGDLRFAVNEAVLEVARVLLADGMEIWPLITPDPHAAAELEAMGCSVIRVMGSAIGSGGGMNPQWRDAIQRTLDRVTVPTMLDGGVGQPVHARTALAMGFDSVLVNSCLFGARDGPVVELQRFSDCVRSAPRHPLHAFA